MSKARLLLGLTAVLSIFAVVASPAAAKFVSNNAGTTGPLQLKAGTSAVFTLENGTEIQLEVKCAELTKGAWAVRTLTKQEAAKEGDHLALTGQFSKCVEKVAGVSGAATVNSTCELQVEQKGTKFTGGVLSTCVVTQAASGCVVTIEPASNTGLSEVKAVNVETKNTELLSNVKGFTAKPNATCIGLGVTATGGGFKATAIAHEVKVV